MVNVWANRLIAGTRTWDEVPEKRKDDVKAELKRRVANGEITAEKYEDITGEPYAE